MRITRNEIFLKVVYYGPGLSGKTTNLEVVHKQLPDTKRGDLTSIATETDRTIFFDCLPYESRSPDGRLIKIQLFTIPGQVYYKSTRKLILQGADGVVFIADAQEGKMYENLESLDDLYTNLKTYRVDLQRFPMVIQYNKRDLDNLMAVEELEKELNHHKVPSFCASALQREGVMDTLLRLLRSVLLRFKLLPVQQEEESEKKNLLRRKSLAKRISGGNYTTAEWAEYMSICLEPRWRQQVSHLLQELKFILDKKLSENNTEHLVELCQAIKKIDLAETEMDYIIGAITPSSIIDVPDLSEFEKKALQKDLSPPAPTPKPAASPQPKPATPPIPAPQPKPSLPNPTARPTPQPSPIPPAPKGVKDEEISRAEKNRSESRLPSPLQVIKKIQELQNKLQKDPRDLDNRKLLLNIFLRNNMTEEALEQLFNTAKIHYENGNLDLCQKCLAYALRLDPKNTKASRLLELIKSKR